MDALPVKRYLNNPHALTAFKVFFNWCLCNDHVDKNPVFGECVTVYNRYSFMQEMQTAVETYEAFIATITAA